MCDPPFSQTLYSTEYIDVEREVYCFLRGGSYICRGLEARPRRDLGISRKIYRGPSAVSPAPKRCCNRESGVVRARQPAGSMNRTQTRLPARFLGRHSDYDTVELHGPWHSTIGPQLLSAGR